jgi:uncharacterized protein YutE (UPF0331/DUF86 family)
MVSVEKIAEKLRLLDEFFSILQRVSEYSLEVFLKDTILIGSAKYYLQVSIGCCLDIANHIISAERFRPPRDYADTFQVLEEQGLVDAALGLKFRQMAKFRNRLVHLYGEIDNRNVHAFIRNDLCDFMLFKTVVAERYFP